MELPEEACKAGARPGWMGYIWVRDLEAGAGQRRRGRAANSTRRRTIFPAIGRFAVVSDPQGANFILFRHFGDQEAPPVAPGTPGHVGWHELHAGEYNSALSFYSGQFGWTKGEAHDMGDPVGIYQLFEIDGVQSGGMMNKMEVFPPIPFTGCYYFNVDDIDAAAARVHRGRRLRS